MAVSNVSATAAAVRASGELQAGKGTVKGTKDYFDGQSVITDADTVVDIATIMVESKASNMSPQKMAEKLAAKGYNVEVVKIGNRYAVEFENGDFFIDSDGDGNLGTKDQNFQDALSKVEKDYGVDLSNLKNSKYTAYHKYSEIGKNKDVSGLERKHVSSYEGDPNAASSVDAMDTYNLTELFKNMAKQKREAEKASEENKNNVTTVLDDIDGELEMAGYNGEKTAYELWLSGELSELLANYGITEPSLPEISSIDGTMNLFGAALEISEQRQQ